MSLLRSLALTLVLSILGAGVGAWGGARYVTQQIHRPTPLHELVHERLALSADQEAQIAGLERDERARERVHEAEMRAANAALAQALQHDHADTPEVQAAIDRFHLAMGALQKETILHILAMRAVLTPEQAAKFDETVGRSLTEEAQ